MRSFHRLLYGQRSWECKRICLLSKLCTHISCNLSGDRSRTGGYIKPMDGNVVITSKTNLNNVSFSAKAKKLWKNIKKSKYRYLLILPGFIWIFVFKYLPYSGLVIAFEDFSVRKGIFGSDFIGLENFRYLFGTKDFVNMIRNTCY